MKYQVENIEAITPKYISDTIDSFAASDERGRMVNNWLYYTAWNPKILDRDLPEDSGPDNRLPVSYARRIINLVDGYMYKPGLVTYTFEDDNAYKDAMLEVFDNNKEPLKTEQMGKQTSTQGVGYEYHYIGEGGEPRFVKFEAPEVIPIWDKAIEPNLLAFIRYTVRDKDTLDVMYVNGVEITEYTKQGANLSVSVAPVRHFYGQVPLVVFRNNEEMLGDFEPVVPLIDAYDVLMSDSMNEFDRFAWAYLLLKGMDLSQENAEQVKRLRAFTNLDEVGDVAFLTKTIDTEFIKFMSDLIRSEIHRQSGIPNLEDYDGAGASGKTLTKFIYLMELFTDPKESYFTDGLMKRIELISAILAIKGTSGDEVGVVMNRNTPDNSLEQAEIFNKYVGHVSHKTLLENFADFVDDPEAELETLEAEGDPMFFSADIEAVNDGEST